MSKNHQHVPWFDNWETCASLCAFLLGIACDPQPCTGKAAQEHWGPTCLSNYYRAKEWREVIWKCLLVWEKKCFQTKAVGSQRWNSSYYPTPIYNDFSTNCSWNEERHLPLGKPCLRLAQMQVNRTLCLCSTPFLGQGDVLEKTKQQN